MGRFKSLLCTPPGLVIPERESNRGVGFVALFEAWCGVCVVVVVVFEGVVPSARASYRTGLQLEGICDCAPWLDVVNTLISASRLQLTVKIRVGRRAQAGKGHGERVAQFGLIVKLDGLR